MRATSSTMRTRRQTMRATLFGPIPQNTLAAGLEEAAGGERKRVVGLAEVST